MANVKYLSYDGLKQYDAKIKDFILKGFANGVSVDQNEENNIINLSANYVINNVATSSIIATGEINLATTTLAGLMSKDDKTKLNGIADGAEVNQNAFSKITIGSTTITADQKTDTLTIVAGDNITLTPDAANDKITIAATDTTYTSGDCITIGTGNKINHNGISVTTTNSTSTINHGSKFVAITSVDTDDFGHLTSINIATYQNASDWTKLDFYATSIHPTTETNNEYTVVTEIKDATHTTNAATATAQYTTVKVPSKKYVDDQIIASFKANDAMIYKGTVSKDADLPYKACNVGWTYRVDTAGTYAGQVCEVGDMIICLTEGTTSVTGTWNVINTNVDGAVYNTTDTSIKGNFAAFDSTTGKLIKDSGYNSSSFAPARHSHSIAATGSGDTIISVVPNGGALSTDYKVTHKTYTTTGFTQSATSAKPGTSIKFNVPSFTLDGYGHISTVTSSAITVTLPAYPTALKNPYKITVNWKDETNTAQTVEYDGSASPGSTVDLSKGIYYAVTASYANYAVTAGCSVTAGNAVVADKLGTSTGSATKPVYFSSGKPVQCTYSLNKTVPSDAVFTDTKNTAGTTDTSSKIFLIGATSQAANPQTYSHDTVFVDAQGILNSGSATVCASTVDEYVGTMVITCNDVITTAEIDDLF